MSAADAGIANTNVKEYTKIPLPQALSPLNYSGTISNVGSGPITNVQMKVNVLNGAMTNVFTATSTAVPTITVGSNAPFALSGFTPTIADVYTVQLINLINETDGVSSNDTVSYTLEFTDTVFARDNGIATGTLGIGPGTAGELGQNFTLANSDVLSSVSFQIGNGGGVMNGQPIFASIYATDGTGTPTTLLATTETLIINNALDSMWTAHVLGGLILPAGTYNVALNEADSNITVATTNQIFTPGKTWVRFGTTPWSNNEAFGFNVSYILRANFGDGSCSATSSQYTASTCSSLISPSGNYTWTTSGTYNDTLVNVSGCDSVITVNLTVNTVNSAVSLSGLTLTAAAAGASYQWIDCNNGNAPISGETGQSFTATVNGSYAVIITQNNCSDTSACSVISNVGLNELGIYDFALFPNPSNGQFTVEFESNGSGEGVISILSADGKVVQSTKTEITADKNSIQINAARLPSGYYFVQIEHGNGKIIRSIAIEK